MKCIRIGESHYYPRELDLGLRVMRPPPPIPWARARHTCVKEIKCGKYKKVVEFMRSFARERDGRSLLSKSWVHKSSFFGDDR